MDRKEPNDLDDEGGRVGGWEVWMGVSYQKVDDKLVM